MDKSCRMCLKDNNPKVSIFNNQEKSYAKIISDCLHIQVDQDEIYPDKICVECMVIIDFIYTHSRIFIENDEKLKGMLVISQDIQLKYDEEYEDIVLKVESCSSEGENRQITRELTMSILNDVDDYSHEVDSMDSDVLVKTVDDKQTPKDVDLIPRRHCIKCYICKTKFDTSTNLAEHLYEHIDLIPYECTSCILENVIIKTLNALNLHLQMHERPIKCEFCDKRYNSTRARSGHVKTAHNAKETVVPKICEVCDKVCPSERCYKEHLKKHNNEFQCEQCLKSFTSRTGLNKHTFLHTGEKPFTCGLCKQRFSNISNYKTHLKLHNGEKPHECKLCPSKFEVRTYLKRHIQAHHTNKAYVRKSRLSEFYKIKIDSKSKNKTYECNTCQKIFNSSASIANHIKIHNKEHQCSFCGQKFRNQTRLSDHENTHTGNKPHKCNSCGKCFASSSNLWEHKKIHTGIKNHRCDVCSKEFTYKENLKSHIKIHHSEKEQHECIICDSKFRSNGLYKRHFKTHLMNDEVIEEIS